MKLTRHNGRAGKNGVYNPKHNDRQFDIGNSEHIDADRVVCNLYWDCYYGYRQAELSEESGGAATFEKTERMYYEQHYGNFVNAQNARNEKNRHTERNRTTEDLMKNKKTCPEETIYQIGTLDDHIPPQVLMDVVQEFMDTLQERFGEHFHILNWALHLDESTPHIHERHVFDCENRYGEIAPQQEEALKKLGFELPDPEKKAGRNNNRKMVFDSTCRVLLFDICRKHGLYLEEQPEYGGRAYLEKQDYILAKQQEQLQAQNQMLQAKADRLKELTLQVNDVELLIEEVSGIAYDKAVEVVTDTVRAETQKTDLELIAREQDIFIRSNAGNLLSGKLNESF